MVWLRRSRRSVAVVGLLSLLGATASCQATRFYERERLVDRSMQFDADDAYVFVRNKTEAAREGSFGGFGAAAAGGCGCQ